MTNITSFEKIYLICEPFICYDSSGRNTMENGEQVLFAFISKENALAELKKLNENLDEEEGDLLYYIRDFHYRIVNSDSSS